jgi:integrase
MPDLNYIPDTIHVSTPSHKCRLIGQQPPLKPREVWAIRIRLQIHEHKRDLALLNLAIDSKLRSCDLVALQISDNVTGGHVRERAVVVQQKTGRPVQFELTEQTREAVNAWIEVDDALQISEQTDLLLT